MTWRIQAGDARAVLTGWPAGSVQTVITSVPYYNLRAYGTAPQIWGGDPACDHVWGERALLRRTAGGERAYGSYDGKVGHGPAPVLPASQTCPACGAWRGELGSEPTIEQYVANLVQVFRAVRRVLRPDGTLWLNIGDSYSNAGRAGSRGAKRGAGKPGWTDGGALGDKQLLLVPARVALALQADGWVLRSEIIWHKLNPMPESVTDRPTKAHEMVYLFSPRGRYYCDMEAIREPNALSTIDRLRSGPMNATGRGAKNRAGRQDSGGPYTEATGRNARDVWSIPIEGFDGAHFAVMPTELARRCILAGSRPGDIVADPFTGAGTVGVVALRHGRGFWGAELNPDYVTMAEQRIVADAPLFNRQQEGAA